MIKNIYIKNKYNNYLNINSNLIYYGEYYLEVGNRRNLFTLLQVLKNFQRAKIDNLNNPFKIWFTKDTLYIKYKPSDRYIGIPREGLQSLIEVIDKEFF